MPFPDYKVLRRINVYLELMRLRKLSIPSRTYDTYLVDRDSYNRNDYGVPANVVPITTQDGYGTSSEMFDTVGKRWKYNEVQHVHCQRAFDTPSGDFLDETFSYCTDSTALQRVCVNYPLSGVIAKSGLDPERISVFGRKFANDLFESEVLPNALVLDRDLFDTNFSVWYLVVDLIDLKGLIRQLLNPERLRRLSGLRAHPKLTLRQLADDHLMVQFGILPTYDDIKTFTSLVSKWRDVYDNMAALCRIIHKVKQPGVDFLEEGLQTDYTELSRSVILPGATEMQVRLKVYLNTAQWHGTGIYKFTAPEFQGWISRFQQFIDAFGILDPAALWDVIPWSFVVDWFFNVGAWLHKNRPRLFPAGLELLNYCESIKTAAIYQYSIDQYLTPYGPGFDTVNRSDVTIGAAHSRCYLRQVGKPAVVRDKGLTMNQSIVTWRRSFIAAALLAQKTIGRRKHSVRSQS